jgi:tetratricopeptide (TPR) repeat protein
MAEPLFRRALGIFEKTLGPDYTDVAVSAGNLARIYQDRGDHATAEPFYRRALDIWERAQGPEDPDLGLRLADYAQLLRQTGRADEAREMEVRAAAIEAKGV